MQSSPDKLLVSRCLAGDQAAFGELIDRYQRPIFNLALRTLHDRRDAEDVTQTVFMKAYQHLDSYDPGYKFFSWIYRIAVNESVNLAKRTKSFEPLDDNIMSSGKSEDELDSVHEVEQGILQLSPEDRALVLLKHVEGFSYKQIAYIMNIPDKKVKSRLYTARQRLKSILTRARAVNNG